MYINQWFLTNIAWCLRSSCSKQNTAFQFLAYYGAHDTTGDGEMTRSSILGYSLFKFQSTIWITRAWLVMAVGAYYVVCRALIVQTKILGDGCTWYIVGEEDVRHHRPDQCAGGHKYPEDPAVLSMRVKYQRQPVSKLGRSEIALQLDGGQWRNIATQLRPKRRNSRGSAKTYESIKTNIIVYSLITYYIVGRTSKLGG